MGYDHLERRRIDERRFRIKDIDQLKLVDDVFNDYTLKALYELMNKGIVYEVYGPVAQGKEAKVVWGRSGDGKDIALKIFYTLANRFKNRDTYILGDPRFAGKPSNPFKLANMWCRKEFRNLKRAFEARVSVPTPIAFNANILVMEFVGDEGVPAPTIKDAPPEDVDKAYVEVLINVDKAYVAAKLIHADLSEYNILNWGGRLVIIDWGSAIDSSHPNALEFLARDIRNVNRFFSKLGADVVDDEYVVRVLEERGKGMYEFDESGRLLVNGLDLLAMLNFT